MNARKERIEVDNVWELFLDAEAIYVINGRKVNKWVPAEENKEAILDKAIGRSGNLRVPTIKVKNVFVVRFNKEIYSELLS